MKTQKKNWTKVTQAKKSPSAQSPAPTFLRRPAEKFADLQAVYQAGNPLGLLDALVFASELGCVPPDWVLENAIDLIAALVRDGLTIGKGQTGNTWARHRKDMEHHRRYLCVEWFRQQGKSTERSYAEAEHVLEGAFGSGDLDAIKKSHLMVRKRLADPKDRHRYYRGPSSARSRTKTGDFT